MKRVDPAITDRATAGIRQAMSGEDQYDQAALLAAGIELVAAYGPRDAAGEAESAAWEMPTGRLHQAVAELLIGLVEERGAHAATVSHQEDAYEDLADAKALVDQLQGMLDALRARQRDLRALAAAIADPTALVGPRRHPSWGPGHRHHAEVPETPPEWAARAVSTLLTGQQPPPEPRREWLVWSNQHGMWWGPGHRGYRLRIEEAGRYTKAEARNIVALATCGWQLEERRRDPVSGREYTGFDEVMVPAPVTMGRPDD